MLNLFSKGRLALLALLSVSAINASLSALDCCDPCDCNRTYVGAFGGALYSNSTKLTQAGTAFFTEAEGGPLAVLAQGHAKNNTVGFGGLLAGYEWSRSSLCSDWTLSTAAEAEVYFARRHLKGHLINPTDRLPEHDFADTFHSNMCVILANAVFAVESPCWCGFSPYVGGGIGAARVSLHHADSLQVDPVEAGVNHFNSKRSDSAWTFAAQLKAGLRYQICDSFHLFGEYRYLYLDSSNYIFGSTVYASHAATSPWNVKVSNNSYNAFAVGFQYDL